MVSSNCGYPDPNKPSEDLSPNEEIIVGTDTDTDDEENPYNEYQPLPTSDVPEIEEDTCNNDSNDEGVAENFNSLPPITSMEETLIKDVWSAPTPTAVDIIMDSSKVDEVKQAMANFTLPPNCIPDWARHIPEEEWKKQLISKLQQK